jgi:peptidoglycan/xylan/chitin deacetylase (PgdA/CDA1 family)
MGSMFRQVPTAFPSPSLIRRVNGLSVRSVALTFDDGPSPVYTPRLLDLLRKAGAAATFFVVGREAERHPGLVRRMIGEGHRVGSHSWSHPQSTTPGSAKEELQRTHDVLKAITGVDPTLFRPPYGIETGPLAEEAVSRGYRTVLWSLDTKDWRDHDASKLSEMVGERSRRGDIVLMHDIHAATIDAVPDMLRRLALRGVRCVTVERLLDPDRVHPGPPTRG